MCQIPAGRWLLLFPFIAVVPSGSAQCDGDGDKNNQKNPTLQPFCLLLCHAVNLLATWAAEPWKATPPDWTACSGGGPLFNRRREGQTFRSVTATVIDCCLFLLVVFGSACPKKNNHQYGSVVSGWLGWKHKSSTCRSPRERNVWLFKKSVSFNSFFC